LVREESGRGRWGWPVEVDAAFDVDIAALADDADLAVGYEDAVDLVVGEGEVEFADLDGIVARGLFGDGNGIIVADDVAVAGEGEVLAQACDQVRGERHRVSPLVCAR